MLVSQSHQFVFVHVPRTGGTSIRQILTPFSTQGRKSRTNKLWSWLGMVPWHRRHFPVHTALSQAEAQLPRQVFREYFKFAFVRNPWERMASHYQALTLDPGHPRHDKVRSLANFDEYISYEANRGKAFQSLLVTEASGKLGLDFLGRFENLVADFSAVCARIGVDGDLPHLNQTNPNGCNWREMYTSQAQAFVAKHWAQEIEMFGYTFDEFN